MRICARYSALHVGGNTMREAGTSTVKRTLGNSASGCVLALGLAFAPALAADAVRQAPVKIAVFDFELDAATPAAALPNKSTSAAAALGKVSTEARLALARSDATASLM